MQWGYGKDALDLFDFIQGQGLGSRLLSFAEGFAPVSQVEVVSCRADLFPIYEKRGYVEVGRRPLEQYIPAEQLTRRDLQMVIMRKRQT